MQSGFVYPMNQSLNIWLVLLNRATIVQSMPWIFPTHTIHDMRYFFNTLGGNLVFFHEYNLSLWPYR